MSGREVSLCRKWLFLKGNQVNHSWYAFFINLPTYLPTFLPSKYRGRGDQLKKRKNSQLSE